MSVPKTPGAVPGADVPLVSLVQDGYAIIPDARFLFGADFARDGRDLVLSGTGQDAGAPDIRIPDYFRGDSPADLRTPDGQILRGATVERLAGPDAPGQYAQAGTQRGGEPIGQVETVDGGATVLRTDGTEENLAVGMKIFQGDVVATDDAGGLSLTFADGTIFTLAAASRMVIDELIYDPDAGNNAGSFTLVQGGFVFIAGQVAKTGGMDVTTPSATMGIRGTTVVVRLQVIDGVTTTEVTLTRDPDGDLGVIELRGLDGSLIANMTGTDSKWLVTGLNGEAREVARSLQDDASDNLLIAEAVAAFQAAVFRVAQGDTFVTLPSVSSVPRSSGGELGGSQPGVEVDGQDEPIPPAETPLDPDADGSENDGNLEESQLPTLQPGVLVAPNLTVTGLEDAGSGGGAGPISGTIVVGTAGPVFSLVSGPANGSVTLNPGGTFSYVPAANFNGSDTFSYSVVDAAGDVGTGTITVNVAPVNDAPVLVATPISGAEDAVITGTLSATDIDGDPLGFTLVTGASNGLVAVLANGTFAYTPNLNFTGTDSFVVRVDDGQGGFDTQTINVTVANVNDPPQVSAPLTAATVENAAPFTVNLLAGATDPDAGAILSVQNVSGLPSWATVSGSVLSVDPGHPALQSLAAGQTASVTVTFQVADQFGATVAQSITLSVTGTNDGPVFDVPATGNTGSLTEGAETMVAVGALAATDPDGDPLSFSLIGSGTGSYGALVLLASGIWSYTIDQGLADSLTDGQTVTDTFTAQVSDGKGGTATQTIAIQIIGTNDEPVVVFGAEITTQQDTPFSAVLTATDVDSPGVVFSAGPIAPANGSIVVAADGSYTYTPNAGFAGFDSFTYLADDQQGGVTQGSVTVAVENTTGGSGSALVSIGINATATPQAPAGSFVIDATPVAVDAIRLVFALDRSGSIAPAQWAVITDAVAQALEQLAAQFVGSSTTVEVAVVTYATNVTTTVYDLSDFEIAAGATTSAGGTLVRALPTIGGATNWTGAFQATEAFFDSQPISENNYLYFVTDGNPTNSLSSWTGALNSLTDEVANGYEVSIDAFAIGSVVNGANLTLIDSDPVPPVGTNYTTLNAPSDLLLALDQTPLFNPQLVDLRVQLIVDGVDQGVVADETDPSLIVNGLDYVLPFAAIAGIADLLGTQNRFGVTARYDLDGDPTTVETTLFTTEILGRAATAQTLDGLAGADLLFGSDLDDTINGAGGDDLILGYDGEDLLNGGAGADTILAGAGDDRIVMDAAPQAGDRVDGGAGRDALVFGYDGDLTGDLLALAKTGVEVIDMQNGLGGNSLTLSLSDVLSLSDTGDSLLEGLLGRSLPDSATIYGDAGETLALQDDAGGSWSNSGATYLDPSSGQTLAIWEYNSGLPGGGVLATLGVDADVSVTTVTAVVI